MLLAVLLLFVNFAVSWWNAYAVGQVWHETKAAGGWPRVLAWSGAVMSACGFTYVYLILLAVGAGALGYLTPEYVQGALELGYVVVILPILGSGMVIWVDSVQTAWRERSFGSVAGAAWNTFAQGSNMYHAAKDLPGIFSHLGKLFDSDSKDDDAKGQLLLLMVLIVVFALAGGVLTTYSILQKSARASLASLRKQATLRRAEA